LVIAPDLGNEFSVSRAAAYRIAAQARRGWRSAVGNREARADRQGGESIDRVAA
jgi:hypothetical protein